MVAVLLTGLRHYEEATGDNRAADAIVSGARFLIDDMWVPEVQGFRYTSCPKSITGPQLQLPPVRRHRLRAPAHRRDAKLREVLVDGTDAAMRSMRGSGKGFTQQTRVTPHFINHLVELREGGARPRKP